MARLKLTHSSFQGWGISQPRIAVVALNPHAGEGGLLGSEEIEEDILPIEPYQRKQGEGAERFCKNDLWWS